MIASVSPRPRPSATRPPASASTRSRRSPHVHRTPSSSVRTATSPARCFAVMRNASASVPASTARAGVVLLSTVSPPPSGLGLRRRTPPAPEAPAGQTVDVVRQTDREQRDDEHEADHAGLLHDPERDRAPADLLGHGPEDVPSVERQEGGR